MVTPLRKAASYEPRIASLGILDDTWLTRGKYGIYVAVRDSYIRPGESHSLSVQCVLMFVTLVIIYGLVHDDLYRPETFQKLEKNRLMVVTEQSERAEIFALLRQKHIYLVLLCASVQEDEVQIVPPVSLVFCCVGDSFPFLFFCFFVASLLP